MAAEAGISKWGSRRLRITAFSGHGLAPKDLNGLSDPYLIIWIGEKGNLTQPSEGASELFKTKFIPKTLNPVWEENRIFTSLYSQNMTNPVLHVVCWDKDKLTADDYMGECEIELTRATAAGASVEIALQAMGSRASEKVSGTITIGLQSIPDPKPPTEPFRVTISIAKGAETTKAIQVIGLRPYATVKDLKDAVQTLTAIPQSTQVFYKHARNPEVEIVGTLGSTPDDNLKRLFDFGITDGVHLSMKQYV